MMIKRGRAFPVLISGVVMVGVLGAFPAVVVQAAGPACPKLGATQLTQSQSFTPAGGHAVVVCTARVPSFDGTPLRVDVTLPTAAYVPQGSTKPAKSPLVMMLSGFSNDVCQFESTSFADTAVSGCGDPISRPGYDWNNAWFASHGFVVLTYTPRGWDDSCGVIPMKYSYKTDPACKGKAFKDPNCSTASAQQSWIHFFDRRWEIRDAQFLAGLIVDSGFVDPGSHLGVDPNHIVTTGDSGGGGPSWDLAFSNDQVLEGCSTYTHFVGKAWTSPKGVPLHLAAAIPMFTWTDLGDALLPNGTASDGFHGAPADGNRTSPFGVDKQTYVFGLHFLGTQTGQYAPTGKDPDINTWYADITAGEPYSAATFGPIVSEIASPLRSPFRMAIPATPKPIFSIQGLTDPLFPATQTITEIKKLKSAKPAYPVWAFLGDVGHHYAQNPLAVWQQAHNESNAWLMTVLAGKAPTQPTYTVDTTQCESGQTLATYTASGFGAIATSTLSLSSAAAQGTTSSTASTSEGSESDALTGNFCAGALNTDTNQATYNFSSFFSAPTIVGGAVVHVTDAVNLSGTTAELAARLWDITPGVHQSLISRTVYRIQGTTGAHTLSLAFELSPNAWQLACGHQLQLERTLDEGATWRPDSESSTMSLSNMSLSVPVVAGPPC